MTVPQILACAGVLALGACTYEPIMTVLPVKTAAGVAVTARMCGSRTPALIHTITVSRFELPRGGTTIVCQLNRAVGPGAEPGPAIVGSWMYGDRPPGYILGRCAPLAPGQQYWVGVEGSGGGSAVFKVDQECNVLLVREDCP